MISIIKEGKRLLEVKQEVEKELVEILVVGVGGGGNNAVERMFKDGIKSVRFICINTDKQVLDRCEEEGIPCMVIGEKVTQGRGAGARPEKGQQAAEENREDIDKLFDGVQMVFVTCGMGGGTGTGAAPVIAKIAKDRGILTVGVVTEPFTFEGGRRKKNAREGIAKLREAVDTLIVIPNDRIFEISDMGRKTGFEEAYHKADEILRFGVMGITDIIQQDATMNLDFADVVSVMTDKGIAHLGIGEAEGENCCMAAMESAINNPLLETTISGASEVIINITGDVSVWEAQEAVMALNEVVGDIDDLDTFLGVCSRDDMKDKVRITVIATGMPENNKKELTSTAKKEEAEPEATPAEERQPQPQRTNVPYQGSTLRSNPAGSVRRQNVQLSPDPTRTEVTDVPVNNVEQSRPMDRRPAPRPENTVRRQYNIPSFLNNNKKQ
ncbi:MAG: cell division protein FtsZ [Lachnospiraceae bacterium]|nr:cell division protein FtsZ [Lachnospiraceae bacterium]